MQFVTISFDYAHVPIDARERLAFSEGEYERVAREIANLRNIHECVVMSTCNRTEYIMLTDNPRACVERVLRYIAEQRGFSLQELHTFSVVRNNEQAILYTFELACGVHSLVIGETQILGQLRTAYAICATTEAVGKWTHRLFNHTLRFAKRMHTQLKLNDRPNGVAYAAVQLARSLSYGFEQQPICVVGAGEMGEQLV
ncbi:MAG: hypothetical protein ACRC5C_06290, partial [Bacilli bacterium]